MEPTAKVLRIGVILGGKLVEERVVHGRDPITIGQSQRNVFSVPILGLPKSWTLFSVQEGRTVLQLAANMDCRLSQGGQVAVLPAGEGGRRIQLGADARGKVVIGELTLLFQLVTAPPLARRPVLPRALRGGLGGSIDPILTAVLTVSLLIHGALFGYFKWWADPPREAAADEIPDQFARVLNSRLPEAVDVKVVTDEPGESQPKEEPSGVQVKSTKQRKPEPGGSQEPAVVSVEEKVQQSALIRLLGAKGANKPFVAVTDPTDHGTDLEEMLDPKKKTGQLELGPGGLGGGPRTGPVSSTIEERPQTEVAGPSGPKTTGLKKAEEEVPGTVETDEIEGVESGSLNPDVFSDVLKKRWYPQALDCYIRVLKLFPNIHGKVSVSLTVGVAGNVTKIDVQGFNADVDTCIASAARTRWKFPKPDEPSTFDFVFVFRKAN